jgi:predicted component of type VI protein secretion system
MAQVTFQVLEGLERGEILWNLPTPITIGREEDNHVRLNDERVSRFHAKIQEDAGRVILTDLESTNGTRINGHPVKMRVLQVGDQVLIGRCLLLYGSPQQIAELAGQSASTSPLPDDDRTIAAPVQPGAGKQTMAFDASEGEQDVSVEDLFPQGPPEVPVQLSPVHAAQVSDILAYVHSRLLQVLMSAEEHADSKRARRETQMVVPREAWHRLQQLDMDLASYLKQIADPSVQ